jgi:hypothetical protein
VADIDATATRMKNADADFCMAYAPVVRFLASI